MRGFGADSRSIVARWFCPRHFDVRRIWLRATDPPVSGFPGLAFLWGGMIAAAPRAAMASWPLRVSTASSAVSVAIFCCEVSGPAVRAASVHRPRRWR